MARKVRQKHIPQRTCIICRRTLGKRELNRIVRAPDGVRYDPLGKTPGRGAYLCHDPRCWGHAIQSRALDRALKTKLKPEERLELFSEIDSRSDNRVATESTSQSSESETRSTRPL